MTDKKLKKEDISSILESAFNNEKVQELLNGRIRWHTSLSPYIDGDGKVVDEKRVVEIDMFNLDKKLSIVVDINKEPDYHPDRSRLRLDSNETRIEFIDKLSGLLWEEFKMYEKAVDAVPRIIWHTLNVANYRMAFKESNKIGKKTSKVISKILLNLDQQEQMEGFIKSKMTPGEDNFDAMMNAYIGSIPNNAPIPELLRIRVESSILKSEIWLDEDEKISMLKKLATLDLSKESKLLDDLSKIITEKTGFSFAVIQCVKDVFKKEGIELVDKNKNTGLIENPKEQVIYSFTGEFRVNFFYEIDGDVLRAKTAADLLVRSQKQILLAISEEMERVDKNIEHTRSVLGWFPSGMLAARFLREPSITQGSNEFKLIATDKAVLARGTELITLFEKNYNKIVDLVLDEIGNTKKGESPKIPDRVWTNLVSFLDSCEVKQKIEVFAQQESVPSNKGKKMKM